LPKGTVLEFVENPEVSIEDELADRVATVDKASKIRKIGKLITKIDKNLGKYSYTTNSKEYENIINKIKKHQKYKTNFKQREAAYKNVASANIYNIVHNIRNRD
jgi:hypothetical protein